MHRLGRLAVAAAAFALEDAELELADLDGDDVGVAFGTGYGCLAANLEYLEGIVARGSRLGNPVVFQNTVPNAAAGYVAIAHGIRGPNATFSSGWIAGLEALDFSVQQIFENQVHTMIVTSADHLCSPLIEGFANRGQISRDGVPRPLDRGRDGTVLSEGACALLLEELGSARRRGAPIYAEVLGLGHSSDPGDDASRALAAAVDQALGEADVEPPQIQAVFSGANGSLDGDLRESRGLWKALGGHAARVPTTCPKSVLGETLGSGGTFAAAVASLALSGGRVPATAHYREPDPECGLNVQTEASPRLRPETALVSLIGDDGGALAAVLQRYER